MGNKMYARARAIADSHEWGLADTGTEQVGVLVEILDGELQGQKVTWYGFFTPATEDRTIEALRFAGWDGSDFLNLPGLGSTEFQLTLEEEENQRGQTYWKAAFINRIGVAMRNVMDDRQKAAFAARMRAKIGSAGASPRPAQRQRPAQQRAANGGGFDTPPPSDDDIPW